MKIIEGLKRIKDTQRKIQDLKTKIRDNSAQMENENPVYGSVEEQTAQIKSWLDSIHDCIQEIKSLRIKIQKTNLQTNVTMEIEDGKPITQSIAEWIHRRRDLSQLEAESWAALTDRGLKPTAYHPENDRSQIKTVQIRRYYDPKIRDKKVDVFTSEKTIIDAKLEVINAETDLLD